MRRATIIVCFMTAACTSEPGRISVAFDWIDDSPDRPELLWIHASVAEVGTGRTLASDVAPLSALALRLESIPNGVGRFVAVELRDGDTRESSRAYYRGRSEPFEMKTGEHKTVGVALALASAPSVDTSTTPRIGTAIGVAVVRTPTVAIVLRARSVDRFEIALDVGLSEGRQEVVAADALVSGGSVWSQFALPYDLCPSPASCVDGARRLHIRGVDELGYASRSVTADVRLDRTGPKLVDGTAGYRLLADRTTNPLPMVSALSDGTRLEVSFALDEAASRTPDVVLLGPAKVALNADPTSGTFHLYALTAGADLVDGEYGVQVTAQDAAGNVATFDLPVTVRVDRTPPAVPSIDRTSYLRTPWGDESAPQVPSFSIVGAASSVDAGAIVIAHESPDALVEIGRSAPADADGRFDIVLSRVDRDDVFVRAVDGAGNASASVPVRRVTWAALPTSAGPHEVSGVSKIGPARAQPQDGLQAYDAGLLQTRTSGQAQAELVRRWRAQPIGPSPATRYFDAAAYNTAQSKLYVFGGITTSVNSTTRFGDTWSWDGEVWSREASGEAPHRNGRMAFDAARNKLVMFGGSEDGLDFDGRTREFDGQLWRVVSASGPIGRLGHDLAYDIHRRVIILHGGYVSGPRKLHDTWEWDGARWREVTTPTIPTTNGLTDRLVYDASNRQMLLIGSCNVPCPGPRMWRYDGVDWAPISAPGPLTQVTSVYVTYDPLTRRVLMTGNDPAGASDLWAWDGTTWTDIADLPDISSWHPMFTDAARGRTLFALPDSTFLTWDGRDFSREAGGLRPEPRRSPGLVQSGDTTLLLRSGTDGQGWLRRNGAWSVDPGAPFGSAGRVAANPTTGDVLAVSDRDTYSWDGAAWTLVGSAQSGSRLAFIFFDGATSTFRGFDASYIRQDWNGRAWITAPPPAMRPTQRRDEALVYDDAAGRVVLFGGYYGGVAFNDTWTWSLADGWRERTEFAASAPPGRESAAMAFDSSRQRVIINGGLTQSDTYELTTNGWVVAAAPMPAARSSHAIVHDPVRQELISFGSPSSASGFADDDTLLLDTDQAQRPGVRVRFDVSSVVNGAHWLSGDLTMVAAAQGDATSGAEVRIWNAGLGLWETLDINRSDLGAPTEIAVTLTEPRSFATSDSKIDVLVVPRTGLGRADEPPRVEITHASLSITYDRDPSIVPVPTFDAGFYDSGRHADANPLDAGSPDAGSADAGSPDATALDAAPADSGATDAGLRDSEPADSDSLDASPSDAEFGDASGLDADIPDNGTAVGLCGVGTATSASVSAGSRHTCAVMADRSVRCWGDNHSGQLGYGDSSNRGSSAGTMGNTLGAVPLGTGRTAQSLESGGNFTCARLDDGTAKCWGDGDLGRLGSLSNNDIGDDPNEMGDVLAPIDLGTSRTATQLAVGSRHTCAIVDTGQVKCWGSNAAGELGLDDAVSRGGYAGSMGDMLPSVDLGGGLAVQIAAGFHFSCALLDDGSVRCWGRNSLGQLGQGSLDDAIGEAPGDMASLLPVNLGTGRTATLISAGGETVCAILDDQSLKCWGDNRFRQLGIGQTAFHKGRTASTMGDNLPAVDLGSGRTATAVSVGSGSNVCALLDDATVKCWGGNTYGGLGLGDATGRGGPGTMGSALPSVDLGSNAIAVQVSAGEGHACARLADGRIKCWGGISGQHGQCHVGFIGTQPSTMGDNLPFVNLGN